MTEAAILMYQAKGLHQNSFQLVHQHGGNDVRCKRSAVVKLKVQRTNSVSVLSISKAIKQTKVKRIGAIVLVKKILTRNVLTCLKLALHIIKLLRS